MWWNLIFIGHFTSNNYVWLHLYPSSTGFKIEKVPQDLDTIVIGSGLGGLSCAACLARTGKRVLVLEQHDRAGGCTHTYEEKGFEFDIGEYV